MKTIKLFFVSAMALCLFAAAPILPTLTPDPYPLPTPTRTPDPNPTPYPPQPTPWPTWTPGPTFTPCSPYCPPPSDVTLSTLNGTNLSSPLFPIILIGLILFLVGLLDRLILHLRGK